jgi:imidazolonepropionase-like amidohydrolase
LLVVALLASLPSVSRAQDMRDHARWLNSSTQTTDDPRRVPVLPGPRGPEGTIVLRGGRVFDGTGTPAREATVVIERNKITQILPAGSTGWPQGARVIDVSGKTVLPGLIDLHTHLSYPEPNQSLALSISTADAALRSAERLRYFVESGITSVRDVSSIGDVPFRLKVWVAANRLPGPRVFPAGQLITGTGGHGAGPSLGNREAKGPDDWREAVREQFDRGADVIKIASHFSRAEVAAAVEEAHTLGLKIMCDCETVYTQWAVEAGVDVIEHPLPRTDETIRLMAQKKISAVPTWTTYMILFAKNGGGYNGSTSRRFTFSDDANLEMMRKMKQAGVKMGVGTDLIFDSYQNMPTPYITELKAFVEAGYTVPEALVAATRTSAEILDMADKLGTIEPGKLADVLVVKGKPDTTLDDLANVDVVIRDGYLVVEDGHVAHARHVTTPQPARWQRKTGER